MSAGADEGERERRWEPNEAIREFVKENDREPVALCPDRKPCQHEAEWGHHCSRDEQGQHECERALAALAARGADGGGRSAINVEKAWAGRPDEAAGDAVWEAIKGWDLERTQGDGYAGATGDDVLTILNARSARYFFGSLSPSMKDHERRRKGGSNGR